MQDDAASRGGSALSEGLGAAPKRDSVAMWGYLLIAHVWGAACYVRPGWFPASVSLVSILIAGLIMYEDKITAYLHERSERESA